MKNTILVIAFALLGHFSLFSQNAPSHKFYLGASYGTSFSLGDFKDDDIDNPDAGFAENGQKLDFYGGYLLDDRLTLTGVFRYQAFDTDLSNVANRFEALNPGATYTVSQEDWNTYSLLLGVAYKVPISKKFAIYPRIGLGPMLAENPGFNVQTTNNGVQNNFFRSSETGVGLAYEIGFGLKTNLGKRFALMPTFTYGGGIIQFNDVVTEINNIRATADYSTTVQAFNIGLSLAYKFGVQ